MASTVRCPICKRSVAADDPNMPFCSDRCRTADLANWASNVYAIPATPTSSPLDDEEPDEWVEGPLQ